MPRAKKVAQLPQAAIALVRISEDRDDRAVGVGRQEEDCRELAERLGWRITEVIVENDTSAFSTKRVADRDGLPTRTTRRPEFRRALKQLHDGRNDGLIVYDLDRLARQPRDIEALIDLAEVKGTPVAVVTGQVDVGTSSGRAMARILVAFANKSSEDTARRVARAARQRAEQGTPKVDGFRPYGYDRDMQIVEAEAAVVREVAARILAGDAVRAIANDLNARGIPPMKAEKWRNPAVKSIVRKATVAGLRSYTPTNEADAVRYGTTYYPGTWEPIIDRETWEAVCDRLDEAGGQSTRAGRSSRYLLSGIAVCGKCGAKLYVGSARSGAKMYRCNECHGVTRSVEMVDGLVLEVVAELLRRPEAKAARDRRRDRAPVGVLDVAALRESRRQIVASAGLFAAADLADMLRAVDEKIAAAEASNALPSAPLPRLRDFADLPLDRKRLVVQELTRVTVLPRTGPAGLDPASVRIEPAY